MIEAVLAFVLALFVLWVGVTFGAIVIGFLASFVPTVALSAVIVFVAYALGLR